MATTKRELYAVMNQRAIDMGHRLDPEVQNLVKAITTEQIRFSQLDTMLIFKLLRMLGIDYGKVSHLVK